MWEVMRSHLAERSTGLGDTFIVDQSVRSNVIVPGYVLGGLFLFGGKIKKMAAALAFCSLWILGSF